MKTRPSPDDVRERMREIQSFIKANAITPARTINIDETSIVFGEALKYQYVTQNCSRAASPPETAGRLTLVLILGSSASGSFLPMFFIAKCNVADSTDYRSSTVLNQLLDDRSFGSGYWTTRTWSIELEVGDQTTVHYRPYLINEHNDIITVQNNAWNDSVGMMMYAQLLLKSYRLNLLGEETCLLVMDNFAAHTTESVRIAIEDVGFHVKCLPANMTDELQPMDLAAVNAQLKAEMRKARIHAIFSDLQEFRTRVAEAHDNNTQPLPAFKPRPPKLVDIIKDVISAARGKFTTPAFIQSMQRVFRQVGLAETVLGDQKYFVQYNESQRPAEEARNHQDSDLGSIENLVHLIEIAEV